MMLGTTTEEENNETATKFNITRVHLGKLKWNLKMPPLRKVTLTSIPFWGVPC